MKKKNGVIYLTFNPSTPRRNAKAPSPPDMEATNRRRVIEDHQDRLRDKQESEYWGQAL